MDRETGGRQSTMSTYETESNAIDGLFVLDDHVESELVVHNGP